MKIEKSEQFREFKNVADVVYHDDMVDKIRELEAKLAVAVEALEKIAEARTCEELYPACEKYKNYRDGWFGVIEFATKALASIKGDSDG